MSNRKTVEPHPNAQKILDFVIAYKKEHDGISPSLRELVDGTGIPSTSTINYWLDDLEVRGLLRRSDRHSRCIEIVGGSWKPPRSRNGRTITTE